LEAKLDKVLIGKFAMGDACRLLDEFATRDLNVNCIAHIRNVASQIFADAAHPASGVIQANPFAGAKMRQSAKPAKPTHKYTVGEIHAMLHALKGHTQAQVAVGLTFFAALRPGEARGTRWENYDGEHLGVDSSVWRTHETAPKTEESSQFISVAGPLRLLLSQLHDEMGNPSEGYILRGVTGCSLNLDRLAQITIRPTLKLAGLRWHGYYAGRRSGATVATSKTKDPTGTASMLRHKDARTTMQFYIGLTPEAQERAVKAVGDEYVAYERKQLADKTENESEISFCTALHSTSEMEVCK
jgi:integrase